MKNLELVVNPEIKLGTVVEFIRPNNTIGMGYVYGIKGVIDSIKDTASIAYLVRHLDALNNMESEYEVTKENISKIFEHIIVNDIEELNKSFEEKKKLIEEADKKVVQESADKAKCSACKCRHTKAIVKSIGEKDRYYAMCTCGNVLMLIKNPLLKGGWLVQETPKHKDERTDKMIKDALESFKNDGFYIAEYGYTKEELETKKASLYESAGLVEDEEIAEEVNEVEKVVVFNHDTKEFYVVQNDKKAINKVLNDLCCATDNIQVFELGSEIKLEKKITVEVK